MIWKIVTCSHSHNWLIENISDVLEMKLSQFDAISVITTMPRSRFLTIAQHSNLISLFFPYRSKSTRGRTQTGALNSLQSLQFLILSSIFLLLSAQTGHALAKVDSQSSKEDSRFSSLKSKSGLLMSGAKDPILPLPPPPFVQEPEDTWVVRYEPIKIYCSARNVMKIAFYCDGLPVSSKSQTTNIIDPDTKSYISKYIILYYYSLDLWQRRELFRKISM